VITVESRIQIYTHIIVTTQHHHHARRAYTKHSKQTKYTHPSRRPSDIGERNVARLAAQQNIGDVVPVEAPSARSHMIRFRQKFVNRTRCDETMNLTKPSCGTQITPRASKASMRPAQNGLLAIRGHTLANSKNMPIRQRRSAQMHAFSCMHPVACIQLHASQSTIQ
jgi:hypothetical protein